MNASQAQKSPDNQDATMITAPTGRKSGGMGKDLESKTLENAFDEARKRKFKSDDIILEAIGKDTPEKREGLRVKFPESEGPTAVVIGLNPSHAKAGDVGNDKTIPLLSEVLFGLGYSEFIMLNLYTMRQPKSKKLDEAVQNSEDPKAIQTDFNKYEKELDSAETIFVVSGKTRLGNDPRNGNPWNEKKYKIHAPAVRNMINALASHAERAEKTWGVEYDDEQGRTITWNVHPAAHRQYGWRNRPDLKKIKPFPVNKYLDWMKDSPAARRESLPS